MIIGNPPYIRHEEITQLKPQLQRAFDIFASTADIYTYFYEQGYKVLKKGALLSFITSNKFCRAGYGENLREFLLENTAISHFVDLNGLKAFESAVVDTCILIFAKAKPTQAQEIQHFSVQKRELDAPNYQQIPQNSLSKEGFIFLSPAERALKDKIEKLGKPLVKWDIAINYGIKTGFNDAFIIDTDTKNKILKSCKDKVERERTAALIKPVLRGKNIKRYFYQWDNEWLINTHNGYEFNGEKIPPIDIADYPALKAFLDKFYPQLVKRADKGVTPYNLRNCAYLGDFEKEKIVWASVGFVEYCMIPKGFYILDTNYFFEADKFGKMKNYLIGLLNSKLLTYLLKFKNTPLGNSGGYRNYKYNLEKLPIPQINSQNSKIAGDIVNLVEQILSAVPKSYDNPHELLPFDEVSQNEIKPTRKSPSLAEGDLGGGLSKTATKIHAKTTLDNAAAINATIVALSKQIDKLVYELYALTPDEIELIENKESKENKENKKAKESK